jgi:hypothetical protein
MRPAAPESAPTPRWSRALPTGTTRRAPPCRCCPTCSAATRAPGWTPRPAGTRIQGPQALLVSNNPYELGDIAGLGRRARLDDGTLGVVAVRVDSALQAIALLQPGRSQELTVPTAHEITIDADTPEIPVGIDGETVVVSTPVRCAIRPGALRVRLPRDRPGVPPPQPAIDWSRLRELASFFAKPGGQLSLPADRG